jgi:hypothetical protein
MSVHAEIEKLRARRFVDRRRRDMYPKTACDDVFIKKLHNVLAFDYKMKPVVQPYFLGCPSLRRSLMFAYRQAKSHDFPLPNTSDLSLERVSITGDVDL